LAYRSTLFKREPEWQLVSRSNIHQAPAHIRSWLQESGSLTRRLKSLAGERFNVSLEYQRWSRPTLPEQRLLGIRHGEYANIREVMLRSDKHVLVVARTVIPRQMLSGRQRHLISLGNRPLGEVIFAEPGLKRDCFEIAVISPAYFLPHVFTAQDNHEMIWGRRTCYLIHDKPILISEIFLPALFQREANKA